MAFVDLSNEYTVYNLIIHNGISTMALIWIASVLAVFFIWSLL